MRQLAHVEQHAVAGQGHWVQTLPAEDVVYVDPYGNTTTVSYPAEYAYVDDMTPEEALAVVGLTAGLFLICVGISAVAAARY